MLDGCKGCDYSMVEQSVSGVDRRRYLHCANPDAGQRCGYIVKMSGVSGGFGDTPAPAWCPVKLGVRN